jgi:hypothetical protein
MSSGFQQDFTYSEPNLLGVACGLHGLAVHNALEENKPGPPVVQLERNQFTLKCLPLIIDVVTAFILNGHVVHDHTSTQS